MENENKQYPERNWDYKFFENEVNNFYNNFDEARVVINNNVIFHLHNNDNFNIENIEKVVANGLEKSLVKIKFSGLAYGWYDPNGEYQEVYKITDGTYKGIIE